MVRDVEYMEMADCDKKIKNLTGFAIIMVLLTGLTCLWI